jgi:hypothetical protein
MPKKRVRKHSARATLTVHELTRAGSALKLEIFAFHEKIGALVIGRGSLYWYGAKRHKHKRISWSRFAQLMDELAYG